MDVFRLPDGSGRLAEIVDGFGFVGAGLLRLCGEPTMLFDPSFGIGLGLKPAEEARGFVRPRHLDAPMVAVSDRR